MMKLSTMLTVIKTVDGDRHSPLADEIAARWGIAVGTARFFRASANIIFRCQQQDGTTSYLRFNADSERTRDSVQSEVDVVNWLADQGVAVARPLLSAQGRWVETVIHGDCVYHAVLFTAADGGSKETEELDLAGFSHWGAALGQLHAVLQRCPAELVCRRPNWRGQLDLISRSLAADDTVARNELARLQQWASTLRPGEADYGLIHYDFEQDNVFWQPDQTLAVIDFDDSARYPYVADIAYALRDVWQLHGVDITEPTVQEFLAGYRSHMSLNETLLSELPMWMRLHNLSTYVRLSRSIDLPADYQGTLADLQQKLARKVAALRAAFPQ